MLSSSRKSSSFFRSPIKGEGGFILISLLEGCAIVFMKIGGVGGFGGGGGNGMTDVEAIGVRGGRFAKRSASSSISTLVLLAARMCLRSCLSL